MNAFSDLRILLVDDDEFILSTIKHMLRKVAPYQVVTAGDGESALHLVQTSVPDVILCDIGMTPMNGLEFVRRLRALEHSELAKTPVIMLTANAEEKSVAEARKLGVSGYILKPASTEQLRTRIEAVCKPDY